MKRHTLPSLIIMLISIVLCTVLSFVWISLFSVQAKMDSEAANESQRLMAGRIESLQKQVSLIASDYHNWTDIYLNAKNLEYDQLSSNYGITAERGDVFQYAELFDGPFSAPISWSIGLGLSPQEGIIAAETRNALRSQVRLLDYSLRQTVDYFEIRGGQLVMFSSSYLLPENGALLAEIDPSAQAVAAIGKILSRGQLADVEREFSISDLEIATVAQAGFVGISVEGVGGEPVAWLQWKPPKPGAQLFKKMVPLIAGISTALALISFFAARLLRARTKILIEQESVSFETARTDSLSKLPNRLALHEYLESLSRRDNAECAVLAIDLVQFKQINDTVGHLGGDSFLVEFSRRLRSLVDETTFVSRFGGDEFIIVICAEGDINSVINEKCSQLLELSVEPIRCNGVSFEVLSSKGMATGKNRSVTQEELLLRADRAMYRAKASRSQEVICYDIQMKSKDVNHKKIEKELRLALVDGRGFEMHYQPIVATSKASQGTQYEALARWSCGELGEVRPDKFIHVAETSGLILPLGWILLDIVCKDMANFENTKININVSPIQLMTPGFADQFACRIKEHGISPTQIGVEVTEQIVVRDDTTIAKELSALHRHGFNLALDDFGTGYSSIGYLTRMPFDVLKIDQSFVRSIHNGTHGTRMLKAMIGLARSMGLEVVAEGIQTAEDDQALRIIGADYLQGYHLGRPMPFPLSPERLRVEGVA